MPEDLWLLPLIASFAFLGSLIFGLTGFGSALVTIPLATHFVPLPFAIAVFSLVDFTSAVRIASQKPKDAVKSELMRLVPFVLLGTVIGATVLVNLPRDKGMLALGSFVLIYAVYALFSRPGTKVVSRHWAYLAGMAGGITGTVFGAGGPPYAIYLSHRPLSKEQFRATLTLNLVFSLSMRIVAFTIAGMMLKAEVGVTALCAFPAAMVGLSLASWVFKRVTRETLLRAVAVLLFVNGTSLVLRALG
jgi:uncharacterized membrane protein YfcA